jgi:hypothetical protein
MTEYLRNPSFAEYAYKGWAPANNGFYGPPTQQTGGLGSHGGPVSADGRSYIYMVNDHNRTIPYMSGISNFAEGVTPLIHQEVRECTQRTQDPVMCNFMGVRTAMGFRP